MNPENRKVLREWLKQAEAIGTNEDLKALLEKMNIPEWEPFTTKEKLIQYIKDITEILEDEVG